MFTVRVRSLVGAMIGVVLTTVVSPAFAQAKPVITASMRQEFRKGFADGSDGLARYLQEDFPAEYEAFETDILTDLLNGAGGETVKPKVVAFMTAMTPKLYVGLDQAPDRDLLTWATTQLNLSKALASFDPAACRHILEGGDIPPEKLRALKADPRTMESVKLYIRAGLAAAQAGRRQPVNRTQALPAEMKPIIAQFRASKGEEAWLEVFGTPQIARLSDDQRCRNNLIWTEAILLQPAPVAARVLLTE